MKRTLIIIGIVICLLLSTIIFLMIRSEKQQELNNYLYQYALLQAKASRDVNSMSIDEMNEMYDWIQTVYPKQDSLLRKEITDLQNSIWLLK